jgi:transposase-like protein
MSPTVAATRTGRPEKLSAAVQARIVNAIRGGASREKAAQAAGIDRSTLKR